MSNYEWENELFLAHYGVKGMKWGVKKDRYKAMDKVQRKKAREQYKQTDEYKQTVEKRKRVLKKAALVGASVAAGMLAGPIASSAIKTFMNISPEPSTGNFAKRSHNNLLTVGLVATKKLGSEIRRTPPDEIVKLGERAIRDVLERKHYAEAVARVIVPSLENSTDNIRGLIIQNGFT